MTGKNLIVAADVSSTEEMRLFLCSWIADAMNVGGIDKKLAQKEVMGALRKAHAAWRRAMHNPAPPVSEEMFPESWASPAVRAKLSALIPKPDGTTQRRIHQACSYRFSGDYEQLVHEMGERFSIIAKKEPIKNPNAVATTILGEWLDDDGWKW